MHITLSILYCQKYTILVCNVDVHFNVVFLCISQFVLSQSVSSVA